MKLLLLIVAATLCGCESEANHCRSLVGNRDVKDVVVFVDAVGVDCDKFQDSKSLRAQYDRWAAGEINIDATATNAKKKADEAQAMATISFVNSMNARNRR